MEYWQHNINSSFGLAHDLSLRQQLTTHTILPLGRLTIIHEATDLLADLLVDRLALLLAGVLEALLLVRRLAVLLRHRPALLK